MIKTFFFSKPITKTVIVKKWREKLKIEITSSSQEISEVRIIERRFIIIPFKEEFQNQELFFL